jgi:hypothetical protein
MFRKSGYSELLVIEAKFTRPFIAEDFAIDLLYLLYTKGFRPIGETPNDLNLKKLR